jgi:hypothetical protein
LRYYVSPANEKKKEVDPTRLELVTSAMRSRLDSLLDVSGISKIAANKHIFSYDGLPVFSGYSLGLLHRFRRARARLHSGTRLDELILNLSTQ